MLHVYIHVHHSTACTYILGLLLLKPHSDLVLTIICFLFSQRVRTKPKLKESNSSPGVWTAQEMAEKEEKIRHLEEVNMSLKQTNVDLNEEVAELKRQIGEFQAKVREGKEWG